MRRPLLLLPLHFPFGLTKMEGHLPLFEMIVHTRERGKTSGQHSKTVSSPVGGRIIVAVYSTSVTKNPITLDYRSLSSCSCRLFSAPDHVIGWILDGELHERSVLCERQKTQAYGRLSCGSHYPVGEIWKGRTKVALHHREWHFRLQHVLPI